MAVVLVGGVASVHEHLLALVQRRLHLLPEPLVSEGDALAGDKLAVEPGRAVMDDLAVEVGGRQDACTDVRTVADEVIGVAALGEVSGDAPVVRVDPLDMAGATQRLQPANVRADERIGGDPDAFDGGTRPLQMR